MKIFVDTGAWLALNDRNDQHHRTASAYVRSQIQKPVTFYTSDYVVDETVTLLRYKVSHKQAVVFLDSLSKSANVVRLHVTPEWLGEGEEIFRKYKDKKWSFTDCVSFAVMDRMGLREVLGFDEDFLAYGKTLIP